jgi:hypothetical protein
MAIQRTLPSTVNADSTTVTLPSRTNQYLEAATFPFFSGKMQPFADEGSYFTTYNVTDGTGIAGHPAPVQADLSTKPLLHIFNGSTTKRIYLDFIRLRLTAIGAGATTTDFTAWIDQNGSTSKTGGTGTVATAVNTRSDQPNTTGAIVTFGVVTASAPTSEKRVDHQRVRSVVPVVEDQYVFTFGNPGLSLPSGLPTTGTNQAVIYVQLPPVCVLPLGNFKLVEWGASQSGAHSFEYTVGWVER